MATQELSYIVEVNLIYVRLSFICYSITINRKLAIEQQIFLPISLIAKIWRKVLFVHLLS